MITSLQTRIDTLESTLARLLKEKGKEGDPNSKSMVDLSLWMSSSPHSGGEKVRSFFHRPCMLTSADPCAVGCCIHLESPSTAVPDCLCARHAPSQKKL